MQHIPKRFREIRYAVSNSQGVLLNISEPEVARHSPVRPALLKLPDAPEETKRLLISFAVTRIEAVVSRTMSMIARKFFSVSDLLCIRPRRTASELASSKKQLRKRE